MGELRDGADELRATSSQPASNRLSSLRIENYRQLRHLEVERLGQVNLVVGGNNAGKSTLLEAIRLLASRGSPSLIEEVLAEHGEYQLAALDVSSDPLAERAIGNLFFGRSFPAQEGDAIYVGDSVGTFAVRLEHVLLREDVEEREIDGEKVNQRRSRRVSKAEENSSVELIEAIETTLTDGADLLGATQKISTVPLADFFGNRRPVRFRTDPAIQKVPTSFVPARATPRESLAEAWDEVVLTAGETDALNALRLIEPATDGLAFIQYSRNEIARFAAVRLDSPRGIGQRFAVIRLKGSSTPVPLQSMGDGMTRVLQLALSALRSRGGFMLVDEIENGLHHSIQVEVWKLLFRLARANRMQVFATTHSMDCVRAFAKVASQHELEGMLLHLERNVESGEAEISVIDEQALADLVSAEIEVR